MSTDNLQMQKLQEDNARIKKELRKVREENTKLKQIISYGNISTLETLIEQYMDYSRIHLNSGRNTFDGLRKKQHRKSNGIDRAFGVRRK